MTRPQDWRTPRWFVERVMERRGYRFGLDVAADAESAVAPRHYDIKTNGLAQSWESDGLWWCNPPWGDIARWVDKALEEWVGRDIPGAMLVPARTERPWFGDLLNYSRLTELIRVAPGNARLCYVRPETGKIEKGINCGSVLFHLTRGPSLGVHQVEYRRPDAG